MNTFLPYPDFAKSASVLDRQRLGKQRVEVLQILRVLTGKGRGWRRHPAVRMWQGHERALAAYGVAVCREWVGRGYRDTCEAKIREAAAGTPHDSIAPPRWLGSEPFHRSHRSNLLRKDPDHYGPLFEEGLPDDLDYVWPMSLKRSQ